MNKVIDILYNVDKNYNKKLLEDINKKINNYNIIHKNPKIYFFINKNNFINKKNILINNFQIFIKNITNNNSIEDIFNSFYFYNNIDNNINLENIKNFLKININNFMNNENIEFWNNKINIFINKLSNIIDTIFRSNLEYKFNESKFIEMIIKLFNKFILDEELLNSIIFFKCNKCENYINYGNDDINCYDCENNMFEEEFLRENIDELLLEDPDNDFFINYKN
jgi:hypothetical protein